ncbi:MAG TPA: methylated-DNA--[protein]-cysteine S-methyltransferase [Gemmatimonadales bacterium]|nr:methylated-DNA--[protein]-cysteine S-methyltransferase [Gemmatimonadales bacterium]
MTELLFALGHSSLGAVLVAGTERGIRAILLGDDPAALIDDLQGRFHETALTRADAPLAPLLARVVQLVESPGAEVYLPLDIQGTPFQRRVWQELRDIPAGSTTTYTDIANRIGSPQSARAVAQACAANPLAVAVPCHRVVRGDGELSGYRWGVERKRVLLEREAS